MLGKRNRKENAVQIDVDWLLGESTHQAEPGFPWFRRLSLSLIAVLVVVWCWPLASRQWLNWELQQQLAGSNDGQSEDVLPIMLAINELNPNNSNAMVEQLASSDANKRAFAFHLLEQRIQQWRQASQIPASELTALIESLSEDRFKGSSSLYMRAQLAAQLRQLVTNDLPNAPKWIASIEGMLQQGELAIPSTDRSDSPRTKQSNAPVVAANFRLGENRLIAQDQIDPPVVRRLPGPSQGHLTSMRKLTDQTPNVASVPLPNLKLSIPRTLYQGMEIQTPNSAEPSSQLPSISPVSIAEIPAYHQEPTSINGIEKLELEKLLPLLNSSQTKIQRQAFNELDRRKYPQSILELAIAMAQGETEEKLKAMDTIARDPNNISIPWLAWMAESPESSVRRRAIALLGSMTDPEAVHKLQFLLPRESDNAIIDQINQVLLASGNASKSVR